MSSPLSPEVTAELEAFLYLGPSLLVTSRDARLLPSLARVAGARLGPDGLLRLAIPLPEGRACLADFADNGCVALTAALPATYQTFQIKGSDAHVLAWPEMEEVARDHTRAFVAQVVGAGLPAELGQAMWSKRYAALAFTPRRNIQSNPRPRRGSGPLMTAVLSLRDLPSSCFDGVFPALLATCSLEGVPNATWLSQVFLVDDEHIALSCQFFRKTLQNLAQCSDARLLIGNPLSFRQYQLDIRFLGRETSGSTFEAMQRRLATVAALTGMESVFALRSADSFVVTGIEEVGVERALPAELAPSRRDSLGGLARFTESLALCGELGALVDTGLGFLTSHLGFESVSLYLLEEAEGVLFALASRGFPSSGVGARIALGEGVVGICGQQRMPIRIADTSREIRYAQAVQEQAQRAGYHLERDITPPGLSDVKSQLVVPLIMQGRLFGVLATESRRRMAFDETDTLVLSTAGHFLAQGIALQQGEEGERNPTDREPPQATSQLVRVRYYEADDSVFIDDDYIIKGLPGRILWLLLNLREQEGRSTFQNRELRLHPTLRLPGYKDNLETRLLVLQRRLEEKGLAIAITRRERGKLRLECEARLELSSVSV